MAPDRASRKLAAIFSADVKGYSRLMRENEVATVDTLKAYREVVPTLIQKYRGRVVDSPGDNVLAEFTSVVDGVECAVEIQKELKAKNADLPENRRMEFRIGINLGDVIEDRERIYGDGVNIAARVEGLAESGGISISGTVYEHVKDKLDLGYESLGEQTVKNIAEPAHVYRVLMEPEAAGKVLGEKRPAPKRWQWMVLSAVVAVAVAVVAIWYFAFRLSYPPIEPVSVERRAFPLPEKPSIAVLPFDNLSGDPEQEYFSDGMTDDLITDLSKVSGLFVIARNSVFTYKGKALKVEHIARELGVRYILEGSVRRVDKRVRINAQLIDCTTGGHLWAERYDGDIGDVFALQDKITHKIVTALAVRLTSGEQQHVAAKETDNIAAYDAFLKGWGHYRRHTPDDFVKAISFLEKATELDPNYGRAYAALALTHWRGSQFGRQWQLSMGPWVMSRLWAREYLQRAMKNPTSLAHQVASEMACSRREHEEAMAEAEQAIALDPNDPSGHEIMARTLIYAGRPKEAIDSIERAMQLDPHHPGLGLGLLGLAHFSMGQSEKAVPLIERALRHNPEVLPMAITLTAAYGSLGRDQEARATLLNVMKEVVFPTTNLKSVMYFLPFKDLEVADRFAEGLLKAGLPGQPSGYPKVSKENRLTGEEIRDVFFGRTMTGFDALYGYQHWMERTKEGEFTYRSELAELGGSSGISGRSSVEGDTLCNQVERWFEGLQFCGPVFRNPDGTPEMLDEYLIVYDHGIYAISPVN